MQPPVRALLTLATACLLCMSAWFSASAVLPQVTLAWHLAPEDGAYLTMAVQFGFVLGALLSAVLTLADIVGPRRLILIGGLAGAAANGSLLLVTNLAGALPLRFATGAALALVYPPFLKVMASWFREGRGTALGIMLGGLTLGTAAPHLFKALGGANWQLVVGLTSVLCALGGVMTELLGQDGPYAFQKAAFDPRQAYLVLHNRGVRLAAFGYFGHMWELYAMWAWFPICAIDVLGRAGIGERPAALVSFCVIAAGSLGCWLGGRLGDRWGRTRATSLALFCSGAASIVVGLPALPVWAFIAVAAFWGFWVNADSAQFSTIVSEVADQTYVGTAMTLQLALGFLLTNVTLWVTPRIHEQHSWAMAFGLLAIGPAAGIVAMQRLRRSHFAALIAGGRG